MADHLNKLLLFSCILSCVLLSAVAISEIDYDELTSGDQVFTIIDIRTRKEVRDLGQIPTSHVLPLLEIEASLYMSDEDFFFNYGFPKLDPNDESLVFTCRSGGRVRAANEILKKYGFNMHRLYLGSFLDWNAHGGPLVKPGHPFQPELMYQPEVIV